MSTPLSERTPVSIDTELAEHYDALASARQRRSIAWDSLATFADDRPYAQRRTRLTVPQVHEAAEAKAATMAYHARQYERYLADLAAANEAIKAAEAKIEPLAAEYGRRPWTRAFLATSSNGHVHKSMACSTCYSPRWDERTGEYKPGTQFQWFPHMSGMDEAAIVEAAGERACTVCYPSAPVAVLARPTTMFSKDEEAKAKAREEREAKRAEREAAQITVTGYREWSSGAQRDKVFKTERAATNAIATALGDLAWYGTSHPTAPVWLGNIEAIRDALTAKGIEYDYDKALANARKRVTRDGGQPRF